MCAAELKRYAMESSHRELEKILKSLANKRRIEMLRYLKLHKRASVGEIAEEVNLSMKSTSKHLAILERGGILEREQVSLQVFYWISKYQKPMAERVLELI